MFIGKSLTNIRILNELSRAQLAEKLGITEQAVWQYENGHVSPKLEVVNNMKKLFHVKSGYFFQEDLIESMNLDNIRIERIAYRSDSINSAIKTQSEMINTKYLDVLIKKISKKIKYPTNEILNLREEVGRYLYKNEHLDKNLQIKSVAQLARETIGLTNEKNQNLLFQLEKSGMFIFEKAIGEKIDAYSVWSEDNIPYIAIGNIKKSAARRNFDLAHELGHLLLHYKTDFNMLDRSAYKNKEEEAHLFASEFLMPAEEFKKDISKILKVSNPDSYIELKEKWLVSLQAMAIRARNLNLITHQQFRYFYMSINKKGYRKEEPLDTTLPIEKPMKVQSVFQLMFDKKIIDLEKLTNELKVETKLLTDITGIDESFFAQYISQSQKSFSVRDLKIIK